VDSLRDASRRRRAALADFVVRREDAVHRPRGAVEDAFVEQRRVHLRGGEVDERAVRATGRGPAAPSARASAPVCGAAAAPAARDPAVDNTWRWTRRTRHSGAARRGAAPGRRRWPSASPGGRVVAQGTHLAQSADSFLHRHKGGRHPHIVHVQDRRSKRGRQRDMLDHPRTLKAGRIGVSLTLSERELRTTNAPDQGYPHIRSIKVMPIRP